MIRFTLDASCSFDPDFAGGEDDPDLELSFECHRKCEAEPLHNEQSGLLEFLPWDEGSNPYSTTCNGTGSNGLSVSTEGCFRANLHRSGPFEYYPLDVWNSSDSNPLKLETDINKVWGYMSRYFRYKNSLSLKYFKDFFNYVSALYLNFPVILFNTHSFSKKTRWWSIIWNLLKRS